MSLGLSRNSLRIIQNITTVVGIMHRGDCCECEIYTKFLPINIYIRTKYFYGGVGRCKRI